MTNKKFLSGFVAVVGRTNVGKSTILNALMGEKLAITSDKPQTTRNKIRCIYTDDEAQIVFTDTPGIHKPKNKLSGMMATMAYGSLADSDLVVFVVEDDTYIGTGDKALLEKLSKCACPVIMLINKADKMTQEDILYKIALYQKYDFIQEILPVSAKTGKNLDKVLPTIKKYLSEGIMYFPEDMITDKPEKFFVAELIREKALKCLEQEIPHGIAVEVVSMKERADKAMIDIDAEIYCERKSHKSIVIGKGGAMLKRIGSLARADIEAFLDSRVNLQLWVKVREEWRDKQYDLKDLGYNDEVQ